MKKFLNYATNFIIILLFAFLLIYSLFAIPVFSYDELWNFQSIYKICNNFTIYKDFNVIITPLFFYLGSIFLNIFGKYFFSFRLYNLFLEILYFIILYKILKKLNFSKSFFIITFFSLFSIFNHIIINGASYNFLATILYLSGIYYLLKYHTINFKKSSLIQGLILFLIFFTKQNIFVFYFTGLTIYYIYYYKNFKNILKSLLISCSIFICLLGIYFAYLGYNNSLFHFLNYTVGSILDFSKNNVTFSILIESSIIISNILVFTIFEIIRKKNTQISKIINEEKNNNLIILFIFSLIFNLILYPLANSAHFAYSSTFNLLFLLYFFNITLVDIFNEKKFLNLSKIFSIAILLYSFFSIYILSNSTKDTTSFNYNGIYRYLYTVNDEMKTAKEIENYIAENNNNGTKVIYISHKSAFSTLPLNINNSYYDLLFNGNLGFNGDQMVINDIKNRKNTIFIITTDEKEIFYQESLEIRNYIINNLNFIGTIENCSIYKTLE